MTKYNNMIIDDTGTDETNRKVQTTQYAEDLTIISFEFQPLNEAEEATYKITLKPAPTSATFSKSSFIYVKFPKQFMVGLGNRISCYSSIQYSAQNPVKCEVVNDRIVKIYNYNDYSSGNFDVQISGIINPAAKTYSSQEEQI